MIVWNRILRVFLLIGLLCDVGVAQAQQSVFRVYGADQGLVSLGTSCVAQDRLGFILVCTDNGVYRFDGHTFERYARANHLPERGVSQDVRLTPDGHIFLIQAGQVFVAKDQLNPVFTAVPGVEPADSDSGVRTAIFGNDFLVVSNHALWIARASGSPASGLLLSSALLARYPALRTITGVATAGETVWLGCANGTICRLHCKKGPIVAGTDRCGDVSVFGPHEGLEPHAWLALLVDHAGTLWARSPERLLEHRAGQTDFSETVIPGGIGRFIGRTYRLDIAEDPRGRIVTQGPSGLLIFDHGHWQKIDRNHGLADGEIAAITYDRDGSLWLAIRGQGLFRAIGSGDWENWSANDGMSNDVCWQMDRREGEPLWVATEAGIDGITASGMERVLRPPLVGASYAVAVTDKGLVWAANLAGLLRRYDPGTGRIDASFAVPVVDTMAIGKDGSLLMATRDGMFRIPDADAASPEPPAPVPGTHGHIRAFAVDPDGMILAGIDSALLRIDPAGRLAPEVIQKPIARAPRVVLSVSRDEIWIGSDKDGLQRLFLSGGKALRMVPVGHPANSSQVFAAVRDTRGWIWIGSDHGVDVWNGRDWRQIGAQDGLVSDDLNEGSMLADPDGTLWFGTGHGLSHLLDPMAIFREIDLHPVITAIHLDGLPLRSTSIPWSHARLTVYFSALNYALGDTIRFRYKLQGVDKDWVETADTTVRYPFLPAGHLTFSVQAFEPSHHLSSAPVSFSLFVRPPWWATWWFRSLIALAVIVIATIVWRLRIRYLMARQRQLEELVRLRTAEIAEAHIALKAKAARDDLTGLLNRETITIMLKDILNDPTRRQGLAVAMADLDHFKSINDRYGHFGGDTALRQVSARMSKAVQGEECAGRYGGEEFLFLLVGPDDKIDRLSRIRDAIVAAPIAIEDKEITVTCSFGLTMLLPEDDLDSLLLRADRLLYRAKADGRNRIVTD